MVELGYDEPGVTLKKLSDGSLVPVVHLSGDYKIDIYCIDMNAAENIRSTLFFGMSKIVIKRIV